MQIIVILWQSYCEKETKFLVWGVHWVSLSEVCNYHPSAYWLEKTFTFQARTVGRPCPFTAHVLGNQVQSVRLSPNIKVSSALLLCVPVFSYSATALTPDKENYLIENAFEQKAV